jgi:hypothetical protein
MSVSRLRGLRWGSADAQGRDHTRCNTWLGDMCDEVRRVVLIEGDTMIIPAGYIHAVVSGHCFVGQDELIR